MKNRRKLLSILLTLSLLVTLLVPMVGPASAGTTNAVSVAPNVTTNQVLDTIIKIDGASFTGTDQIQILLPSGTKFNYGSLSTATAVQQLDAGATGTSVEAYTYTAQSDPTGATSFALNSGSYNPRIYTPGLIPNTNIGNGMKLSGVVTLNDQLLAFNVQPYFSGNGGYVRIAVPITVASASSGPVKATIQDTLNAVTAGQLVIGNVVTGNTTTSVTSTASVAQNSQDSVTFLINENVPGALHADSSDFYVDLPAHFTWGTPQIITAGGFATENAGLTSPINKTSTTTNSQGNSRLDFTAAVASSGMPGTIQVTVPITADYNAPNGDITATFGGTNPGFTASTAVVGTCGNYNITATSGGTPNIFMGQTAQTVGNFTIAEGVSGTLIPGRTISVTLPGGAKWGTAPTPVQNSGSITLTRAQTNNGISTDGQTANYVVGGNTGTASNFTFTQGQVNVDATGNAGTLTATISGSGLNATVDIAKIVSPVTATAATTPDVVIGSGDQVAGDFTIVESAPGAIMATPSAPQTYTYYNSTTQTVNTTTSNTTTSGYLKIYAPSGVTFAGVPAVKVTSGDLNITASGATLTDYNGVLNSCISIPISNGSTTASTISVSGVKLNIDNSVSAGKVSLVVGGNSIVSPSVNGTYVTSVPVANCTSSIAKTTGGTAVFTIGSTDFTMNGSKQTMDAAPYLKNDRTYLPIRFVAQAVGVADSNIIWNSDDQSVTLIKGGTVVKLVIGSNIMTINGTPVTMDTAPEIVDPGRTMLPVSWVGKALGCQINWDAATQTVTVQG